METVAAIINPNSVQLEAACIPTYSVPLLENRDVGKAATGKFVCRAYSRRASTEDHHVRGMLMCLVSCSH